MSCSKQTKSAEEILIKALQDMSINTDHMKACQITADIESIQITVIYNMPIKKRDFKDIH